MLSRFCRPTMTESRFDLMVSLTDSLFARTCSSRPALPTTGGFGYAWPSENLHWQDLVKRPSRAILCKNAQGESFRFQAYAVHDKGDPLLRYDSTHL